MKIAFLAPVALASALAGCASLDGAAIVASSTVNPNYAAAAVQAFNTAEQAADAYLKLPACVTGGSVVCRNSAAVATIVPLIRTGRTARNAVMAALHASNGGAIPVASYNTLQAILSTLNSVSANYGIPATSTTAN